MSAHLSNEVIEQFHRQALTGGDRGEIYNHILRCETCRQRVVTPQVEAVALRTLTGQLLPTEDEEPFHLELETIEAFVDDTLDPLDRSTVKLHLEDCTQCAAEVSDLRESLATMKAASRRPSEHRPAESRSSRSLKFSMPIRIAAMVALIAFAALALIAVFRWRSSSPSITTGSQPTPFASPQRPALTPSPSTGANAPKLAENPPTKEPNEQPRNVIALKDGPNEIALDQGGNVVGLSSLPAETREAVREALTEERLNRPSVLDEVTTAEVSVRGPGSEEHISILSPANTVINNTKPTMRWVPSKTAEAYRVEIADETFRQVAKSEDLPAVIQSWTPTNPLKRGVVYRWTIRAVNKGGEPSSVTSQAKFKVLGEDKLRALNQLKAGLQSHLALGLFYAREGMVADAEREFQILVSDNPRSTVLKRLLRKIQSWHQG